MDIKNEIRRIANETGLFVTSQLNVYSDDTSNRRKLYSASSIRDLYDYLNGLSKSNGSNYEFYTKPFDHQKYIFELSRDKRAYAFLMEMGTGKTKVSIDNCGYLYKKNEIDSVIVFAPNGVHTNWSREVDRHLHPLIERSIFIWNSGMTKKRKTEFFNNSFHSKKFKFLLFNIESVLVKDVQKFLIEFMTIHKSMLIIDESSRIKNPKAKRTKQLTVLGKYAAYKRILTGTPVTQSPLDVYSQFTFLDDKIFGSSFYVFKAKYAEMYNHALMNDLCKFMTPQQAKWIYQKKCNGAFISNQDLIATAGNSHSYVRGILNRTPLFIQGYKNLDDLTDKIKPISYRIMKSECLDLPRKVYVTESVALDREARLIYDKLNIELLAELHNHEMSVPNILTKMIRLQQITGGFFKPDGLEDPIRIPGTNHKLNRLKEILEESNPDRNVIIWCRFIPEILMLKNELSDYDCLCYYGVIDSKKRVEILDEFQRSKTRKIFIGNTATAGIGINLTSSDLMIYYSNSFSLEERLQSEDRAHRIGQKNNVTYIDLVVSGTIDEQVSNALSSKLELSKMVVDDLKSFING